MLIRDLPIETKQGLRALAEAANSSMEAEARRILKTAVAKAQADQSNRMLSIADRIHARFAEFGGVDLVLPEYAPDRPLPDFSGDEYAFADEAPLKPKRTSRTKRQAASR
jgi:plasmid stability protein